MYAVIKSGGKQYRVEVGHVLKLETLPVLEGEEVKFDEVLMVADGENVHVGTPLITHASVQAEVLSHGRHKKIRILKFRRRKHHMKRMGHRQNYTEVKITAINAKAA
jgi:large subunit ribosomal protein L21